LACICHFYLENKKRLSSPAMLDLVDLLKKGKGFGGSGVTKPDKPISEMTDAELIAHAATQGIAADINPDATVRETLEMMRGMASEASETDEKKALYASEASAETYAENNQKEFRVNREEPEEDTGYTLNIDRLQAFERHDFKHANIHGYQFDRQYSFVY